MCRHASLPLLLASLLTLVGCSGGSPSTPAITTPPVAPLIATLPGNWQMEVESTATPPTTISTSLANFTGALSVQGSAVTGIFRVVANAFSAAQCVSPTQNILFTGSVDTTNLLTLTSAPFSGSVAVISLPLPIGSGNIARGTIVITGGACSLASSTVLGVYIPSLTGTYTGTAAPNTVLGHPPAAGGPAKLVLAQAPANVDGQFPVSGSFAFNSPTCTISTDLTGIVTGLNLNVTPVPAITPTPFIFLPLLGPVSTPAATRLLNFIVPVGTSTCAQGNYTGQLTQQ